MTYVLYACNHASIGYVGQDLTIVTYAGILFSIFTGLCTKPSILICDIQQGTLYNTSYSGKLTYAGTSYGTSYCLENDLRGMYLVHRELQDIFFLIFCRTLYYILKESPVPDIVYSRNPILQWIFCTQSSVHYSMGLCTVLFPYIKNSENSDTSELWNSDTSELRNSDTKNSDTPDLVPDLMYQKDFILQ